MPSRAGVVQLALIRARSCPLTFWGTWGVGIWSLTGASWKTVCILPLLQILLSSSSSCMLGWTSPKLQHPALQVCPCSQKCHPGAGTSVAGLPLPHVFDCIYGPLICASSQDQIHLQVLISFRLIEVQAHEVLVFDPQIGYESQSNRLIFTHSGCPGLQAAREKSMKSANDSQFIEQLPF